MSSPGHQTYAAALEALHADLTSDEGEVRDRAGVEAAMLLEWRRRHPLPVEGTAFVESLSRPSLHVRPPTDEEADQLVEHVHAEVMRIVRRGGARPGTPALLFALQKGLRASSRAALIDIVLHHSDELDGDELAAALDALERHLYEDASSDWSSELGSFDTWRSVLAQIAARHADVEELVQDAWSIDAHVGILLAPAGFRESMRFTMMQLRKHMIGSPEELRAAVGAARLPIMQTVLVPLDASDDGMRGLALGDRVNTFSFMYRWNEEGDVTEFRWLRLDEDEVDPRALEIGRSILDLEADRRTRLGPFPGEDTLDWA